MGTILGTSTVDTGVTYYELHSPELGYITILLMAILGVLMLDLFRRIFTKR